MLFNSVAFFLFLPVVFAIYWSIRKFLQLQNIFLLLASYVFYAWWDWRFLGLIIFSTVLDYVLSRNMTKLKLWLSILGNLGILGFFKYYNFFIDSWMQAWGSIGFEMHNSTMKIILPVGISFYTFQTLSYSIDVYRGKLKPTNNPIAFAAFVGFFPQLVAGPIERAVKLMPQLEKQRKFDYEQAVSGLRLILWGLFKKVVVADTCARYADAIFSDPTGYSSPALFMGAVYFSFQIYGDFSGYSDIAIGTARLFGIRLSTNFKSPYFSRNIAEFWRRWHISLSTWFRDYLYIPLGGSRGSKAQILRNVAIIFLVSGLWHGAKWTFVIWGGVHALLFILLILTGLNRNHTTDVVAEGRFLPSIKEFFQMSLTFTLVTLAWVFFRADSWDHAIQYFGGIFSLNMYAEPYHFVPIAFAFIAIMVIVDWFSRTGEIPRWWLTEKIKPVRWSVYSIATLLILKNLQNGSSFIYFQF